MTLPRTLVYTVLACLLGLAAAGCGLKGDLYLEEEPPAAENTADDAQTGSAPAE